MNNYFELFEYVQDLIIADDKIKGLPYPVNHDDAPSSVNPDDANSSSDEFVELHKKSKCYKDDNFEDFVCDECDCKEWN